MEAVSGHLDHGNSFMMTLGHKNFARYAGWQDHQEPPTRRPVLRCTPAFPQHRSTHRRKPPTTTPVSEAAQTRPLKNISLESTQAPHPQVLPPALPRLRTAGRPRLSSAILARADSVERDGVAGVMGQLGSPGMVTLWSSSNTGGLRLARLEFIGHAHSLTR